MKLEDLMSVGQCADRLSEVMKAEGMEEGYPVPNITVHRYITKGLKVERDRAAVKLSAYKHEALGYIIFRKDLEWWIENVWKPVKRRERESAASRPVKEEKVVEERPYFGKGRRNYPGRKNAERNIVVGGGHPSGGASHEVDTNAESS